MRVIERGHIYELANKGEGTQLLTFIKNLPENGVNHDGVQCQEVLRALIDRVLDLNSQLPCHENIDIISHLRSALILFEKRAVQRMLEKSYKLIGKKVEELPVKENGHIFALTSDTEF